MIVLYVDGSFSNSHKGRTPSMSWAVVAHHGDQTVERYGRLEKFQNGDHELVAFFEGYLYAKSVGFKPEQMSFHTDDAMVAYASYFLHPGNRCDSSNSKIRCRVREICGRYYTPELYEEVIECLKGARFTKVKGHRGTVYNLRVDYLAKVARDATKVAESFEDWLKKGFLNYTENGPFMWLAPFAR